MTKLDYKLSFFAFMVIFMTSIIGFDKAQEVEKVEVSLQEEINFDYLYKIPEKYHDIAVMVNIEYNFDFQTIYRIADRESGWGKYQQSIKPNQNGSIDYGVMQLNSNWLHYFERFFDPEKIYSYTGIRAFTYDPKADLVNIQVGFAYLRFLVDQLEGDLEKAIMAYNTGIGNVKRGYVPESTWKYVDYVVYQRYQD